MVPRYASATAEFSPCRKYRYTLTRAWRTGPVGLFAKEGTCQDKILAVIGLNPSTATAEEDDPTIRRCVGYAKWWGCSSYLMLNMFAFRATDPAVMKAEDDPVGSMNEHTIRRMIWTLEPQDILLCAWGKHGTHRQHDRTIMAIIHEVIAEKENSISSPMCLGTNKDGTPKHPLYLRKDALPKVYEGRPTGV